MAWPRNSNRGRTEPSAEQWRETGHDSQGKKHSIMNYSSTLNSHSHMSQTERVFGVHVTDDHHRPYSPPRINLFKDHGDVIDDHSHFPRSIAYGSPKKAEEFSPKGHRKGSPLNSAARMKPSPFSRDDVSSSDASDDDMYPTKDDNYDRHGGYGGSYSPKLVRTKPEHDTDYGRASPKSAGRKTSFVPLAGYASDTPKAGVNPSYGSPAGRKPNHTLPVKDPLYETANNTSHDNGKGMTVENPKPKYAQPPQVSPLAMTRPRKEEHQQTIDSIEACKRYGGIAVNPPKQEEEYTGTINCIDAARKYDGIFVPSGAGLPNRELPRAALPKNPT